MGLWCGQTSAGGWVVLVVAWAVVLGVAVWAVCRLVPAQRSPDPRAVLDARLASGEIDVDTYQQVLQQVGGQRPVPTKGLR
jgi:putative membrane protein